MTTFGTRETVDNRAPLAFDRQNEKLKGLFIW